MTTVLIVNDERDLTEVCRCVLEHRGYDVHTRWSADGLAHLVADLRPDVVVLDWFIGDTTADRVLPTVRRAMPGAAVLVMSASPERASTAKHLGASSFLGKPFDATQFVSAIKLLVEERRSRET